MNTRAIINEKNAALVKLQQQMIQYQNEMADKLVEVIKGATDEVKAATIVQITTLKNQITQNMTDQQKLQTEKDEAILIGEEKLAAADQEQNKLLTDLKSKFDAAQATITQQASMLDGVYARLDALEVSDEEKSKLITDMNAKNDKMQETIAEIKIDYINWKTTLFDAVKLDNLNQLKAILPLGVDISQTNEAGETVLHIAAKRPLTETNQQIINLILELYPDSFNALNKAGKSAIEEAAMTSDWDKLNWLDDEGKSIVKLSRKEMLNKLYSVASVENKIKLANKQLHEGAKQGNLQAIEQALAEGANINDITYKSTALYNAVAYQYSDCVAFLLAKGADESIPCGLEMPYDVTVTKKDKALMVLLANKMLIHGVIENNKEAVADALSKNANISQATYTDNETALHIASASGAYDIVKLLIENQANILQPDNSGQVALHKAAAKGHESVLQCLIEQHVKNNPEGQLYEIVDAQNKTPLDSALLSGDTKLPHKMSHWAGLFGARYGSQVLLSGSEINLNKSSIQPS